MDFSNTPLDPLDHGPRPTTHDFLNLFNDTLSQYNIGVGDWQ